MVRGPPWALIIQKLTYRVSFGKQQLRQIRSILPRDTGDEGDFTFCFFSCHGCLLCVAGCIFCFCCALLHCAFLLFIITKTGRCLFLCFLLWLVSCLVIISCDDGYFDLRQARWCMSGTSAFGIPASDLLGSSGAHNSLGKIHSRRPMRITLTHSQRQETYTMGTCIRWP